jgi:phospholipid/cholesterol/gamma-HCH transport system substrate-binding protein
METKPPTVTRLLIAIGFALSCFALALFLWIAFGGPVPLKPEGYRIEVPFTEATQLAQESDVRISGVSIGKVKRIDLNDAGEAVATLEIQSRYAPIPSDARAILRQKTLLGETYVELTPGSDTAAPLAEGDELPVAQVASSVQLDEIFRTFDTKTREAFQQWMQGAAGALNRRGVDLSTAIASLDSFAREADTALRLLDSQQEAVSGLVNRGGEVFSALSERTGQLSSLIRNTQAVFSTTARRNEDLKALFTVLPTFLRESRETLTRLDEFAVDANPVITQLRPSARELGPTLTATADLAAQLEPFFTGLNRAIDEAPSGFGALRGLLDDDLPPLLGRLPSFLDELTPILTVIRQYRHEVTAFLGNVAASTNATNDEGNGVRNYLRTIPPFSPQILAAYPRRLSNDRTNPYFSPGNYHLKAGLQSFETRQCTGGINAILDANAAANPNFNAHTGGDVAQAQDLLTRIKQFVFADQTQSASVPTPGCNKQAPQKSIGGAFEQFTDYLHVRALSR